MFGEFDIVAVNLFAFGGKWRYAFALNEKLPGTEDRKIAEDNRKYLIKSNIPITWPLKESFTENPFELLDELVERRRANRS